MGGVEGKAADRVRVGVTPCFACKGLPPENYIHIYRCCVQLTTNTTLDSFSASSDWPPPLKLRYDARAIFTLLYQYKDSAITNDAAVRLAGAVRGSSRINPASPGPFVS